MKLADIGSEHQWFRQRTKDLFGDLEENNFEKIVRNQDSYLGKIFSKTFSDFQPFCNLSGNAVSRGNSLQDDDFQRIIAGDTSMPNSQGSFEKRLAKNQGTDISPIKRRKTAKLEDIKEEAFIEEERVRRVEESKRQVNLLNQSNVDQAQANSLMLIPKFCDKKNGKCIVIIVLKKISSYVKSIIFSHPVWISRSNILSQIYHLDRDTEEFTYSNSVTRSNLKRRVYDSINVLYASGIVERRVETINTKKEYFFKPHGPIGSCRLSPDADLLKNREAKQRKVREKLMNLHKAHKHYQVQNIRYQIINKLIQRNKKNEILRVKQIDLSANNQVVRMHQYLATDVPLRQLKKRSSYTKVPNSQPSSQEQHTKDGSSADDITKVFVPFYILLVTSPAISFEKTAAFDGTQGLILHSKTSPSPFFFEDFEIIKKLV